MRSGWLDGWVGFLWLKGPLLLGTPVTHACDEPLRWAISFGAPFLETLLFPPRWATAFEALPLSIELYSEELLIRTAEMTVGDEVQVYKGFLNRCGHSV